MLEYAFVFCHADQGQFSCDLNSQHLGIVHPDAFRILSDKEFQFLKRLLFERDHFILVHLVSGHPVQRLRQPVKGFGSQLTGRILFKEEFQLFFGFSPVSFEHIVFGFQENFKFVFLELEVFIIQSFICQHYPHFVGIGQVC